MFTHFRVYSANLGSVARSYSHVEVNFQCGEVSLLEIFSLRRVYSATLGSVDWFCENAYKFYSNSINQSELNYTLL